MLSKAAYERKCAQQMKWQLRHQSGSASKCARCGVLTSFALSLCWLALRSCSSTLLRSLAARSSFFRASAAARSAARRAVSCARATLFARCTSCIAYAVHTDAVSPTKQR